jgi:hypothetical protein
MPNMRSIEIDFDVHQQIELERISFEETPNEALRRLLKLPPAKPVTPVATIDKSGTGVAWSGKGVTLPHGTEVQMEYNGKMYSGHIADGEWVVEGNSSKSPSDAAGSAAKTKSGKNPSLNGWIYWQVKRPGDGAWSSLGSLRSA